MSSRADSLVCVAFPSSISDIFSRLTAFLPLLIPLFFLTTSKLPLGLYCILQSENVMNAFDMCEGILKHTDILKPLQRDVWRRIQLACVCSKIRKSCCVEGEGCHYCRQIQGWEVSVGWLEVSRDCKQLNKRGAKVMLHFVSVGVGPLR